MEKETSKSDDNNPLRILLDASFKEPFSSFAFNDTCTKNNNVVTDGPDRVKKDSHQKYFLPRVNLTNCDVLIDGRSFYNQPIGNQIKYYD